MNELTNSMLLRDESLFATANGYIGVRGNFEEGYKKDFETKKGTYLNGFFDTHIINYSESAYGFPEIGETIVNVLDGQQVLIHIDGDVFSIFEGQVIDFNRYLDLDQGYCSRKVHWKSPKGHELQLEFKRMTSFVVKELFLIDVEITSINYEGTIKLESFVDGRIQKGEDSDDPRVATEHIKPLIIKSVNHQNDFMTILGETERSKEWVQLDVHHSLQGEIESFEQHGRFQTTLKIEVNQTIDFTKYMIYTDGRKHSDTLYGNHLLTEVVAKGKAILFEEQKEYLSNFWSQCEIDVYGQEDLTYAIKYSQYQLLAAAGDDGLSQVAAKGLTGAGYEGHYFWDTEIYVIPFFTLTNPELAKSILKYRYTILEASKKRSLELGHTKGAKIPWRTISGRECSSYFPAGTAQYHINADVAYGYIQYYLMTDDNDMMSEFGFELLYETALLWLEVGHFNNNEFCIDAVTGPDEYTAVVNNNYYTNSMAKYHMTWVVKLYEEFGQNIADKDHIDLMSKASELMRLPFDQSKGIHKQDDDFLNKKVWDFEHTPKDKYPLLLNYHPLTIYRHQVLKQADTVLSHFLLDDTSDDIMSNSYHYYENLTTHDSSLSPCVYGMMASKINEPEKAIEFFNKTVYLDINDLHHNTKDGIHIANAGGTYMAMVYGFGGLRIKEDGIHLKVSKPKDWQGYAFNFVYKTAQVKVKVSDRLIIETTKPVDIIIDSKLFNIIDTLEVEYYG